MSSQEKSLRWRLGGGEDAGLEHAELKIGETGIVAETVVVAGSADAPHAARARITLEPDWSSTRSLHLTRLGGPTVALRHDGYGEWSDGEGKKRKEFQGLSDCLVAGSPFSFSQVLKRLGAKAAKTQSFEVVLVGLPGLAVAKAAVRLEPIEAGRRFRFTLADTVTEVEVDAEGYVTRFGEAVACLAAAAPEPVAG